MPLFRRNVCSSQATRNCLFLAIAFLLSLSTASAHAATYYVATNGSDSAAGTEAAPFKTIAHAVDKMVAGDTTYVKGGTYKEDMIWFKKSGTASAPIRLLNAPGESPRISFKNPSLRMMIATGSGMGHSGTLGWITVEGLEITDGIVGISLNNAHDVVIRRNWIHHNVNVAGIVGNGKNVLIDRNVINHNGDFAGCAAGKTRPRDVGTVCSHDHGIYATGSNWVITNNLIYDNLAFGIQVAALRLSHYADSSYGGASGWLIANNTIGYNNHRGGIVLWKPGANNRIINNIFYENSQKYPGSASGVGFLDGGSGHMIQNNICYATAPGNTACIRPGGATYTESGNIVNTVNPGFVSAGPTISGVPNFKLQTGSPAIDKGQSLSQVTWDHAGGKRPHGAAFDIGAYEFGSPPDSGSPPPNPTGGNFPSGAPVLLGPNGEVCYSGYN